MIKKGLKYLVKAPIFLINMLLKGIGWTLIGIAKLIRTGLFKYYLMRKYFGWGIQ